jgi:transcriptional regulator with XRE-family HTH domain
MVDKKEKMPTAQEFGKRIKNIRKHLKLTQKDFAAGLSISYQHLSEIENGKTRPGFEIIFNLLSRYSANLDYLFLGIGKLFRSSSKNAKESGEKSFLDQFSGIVTDQVTEYFIKCFFYSRFVRYTTLGYFEELLHQNREIITEQVEGQKR